MRILRLAAATLLATALAAAPATATDVEVEVTAGALAITLPNSVVDLGAAPAGGSVSTQLGTVEVTDTRGALASAWTAQVSSSDWVHKDDGAKTIAKTAVFYWSGTGTSSGLAVHVPGQLDATLKVNLSATRTAFQGTVVVGTNSVSWNPTVVVEPPGDANPGVYEATITHSLS